MQFLDKRALGQLGSGISIDSLSRSLGISRAEFLERWKHTAESRVPSVSGVRRTTVSRTVEICRNAQGVPHIFAESNADLFFGFGYAMGQDRLFQLDWLRRKGAGRLSEILGPGRIAARPPRANRRTASNRRSRMGHAPGRNAKPAYFV